MLCRARLTRLVVIWVEQLCFVTKLQKMEIWMNCTACDGIEQTIQRISLFTRFNLRQRGQTKGDHKGSTCRTNNHGRLWYKVSRWIGQRPHQRCLSNFTNSSIASLPTLPFHLYQFTYWLPSAMPDGHTNTATAPLSAYHGAPVKTMPIQADLR